MHSQWINRSPPSELPQVCCGRCSNSMPTTSVSRASTTRTSVTGAASVVWPPLLQIHGDWHVNVRVWLCARLMIGNSRIACLTRTLVCCIASLANTVLTITYPVLVTHTHTHTHKHTHKHTHTHTHTHARARAHALLANCVPLGRGGVCRSSDNATTQQEVPRDGQRNRRPRLPGHRPRPCPWHERTVHCCRSALLGRRRWRWRCPRWMRHCKPWRHYSVSVGDRGRRSRPCCCAVTPHGVLLLRRDTIRNLFHGAVQTH
jgi:hypothetical protein